MEQPTNGAPQSVDVRVTHVPTSRGGRLVYCTVGGQYLGSVEFDVSNTELLPMMSTAFGQYVAQATSGIQIAGANAVPGIRTS